jgi:hypothetical protein
MRTQSQTVQTQQDFTTTHIHTYPTSALHLLQHRRVLAGNHAATQPQPHPAAHTSHCLSLAAPSPIGSRPGHHQRPDTHPDQLCTRCSIGRRHTQSQTVQTQQHMHHCLIYTHHVPVVHLLQLNRRRRTAADTNQPQPHPTATHLRVPRPLAASRASEEAAPNPNSSNK